MLCIDVVKIVVAKSVFDKMFVKGTLLLSILLKTLGFERKQT